MADDDLPDGKDPKDVGLRIANAPVVEAPGVGKKGSAEHDALVEELNREYALVLIGSKSLVLRQQPKAKPAERFRFLTVDAFKQFLSNRIVVRETPVWIPQTEQIVKKGKESKLATLWLNSPLRRTYEGVEFFPDPHLHPGNTPGQIEDLLEKERPTPNYLNLWQGFSVTPDFSLSEEDRRRKYNIFYDHLMTNICNGNVEYARWVFAWFAHMVQRPRERAGTAIALRGGEGVGKTKLGEVIGSLFASHYFLVDDARYLTGNFNAHMSSCMLLQVDEGFWAGDKGAEGRLKSLITAPIQMIESKGVDPVPLANCVRVLFTSNEDWVVPVGMEGRRFAVFDVAANVQRNHEYFRLMEEELSSGGREALLADLLLLDLKTAPDVRVVPQTAALLEQKLRSLDPITSWWFQRLQDGAITHRLQNWPTLVPISTLFKDYLRTSDAIGIKRKSAETEFGIRMKKLIPGLQRKRSTQEIEVIGPSGHIETVQRRVNCFVIPTLDECRAQFEKQINQEIIWPDQSEDESEQPDAQANGGAD